MKSSNKVPSKKLLEAARNYLESHARFCVWDNHEDLYNEDHWEGVYDFVRTNKMPIIEFIHTYLENEIQKVKNMIDNEDGEIWNKRKLVCQFLDESV